MTKFSSRMLVISALLVAGIGLQTLLRRHVQAAADIPAAKLQKSLVELPHQLGPWQGRDRSIDDSRWLFADDHLFREYHHTGRGQSLVVWMAFSQDGADRGHHPEVCMAVAGQPEDTQARRTLAVAGHEAPIQRYRFGRPANYQVVYYWHYTLSPATAGKLDALQAAYLRSHQRPASLTLEVFAPDRGPGDAESAEDFVRSLDAAVQQLVGPRAVRGSKRLPVIVIERT